MVALDSEEVKRVEESKSKSESEVEVVVVPYESLAPISGRNECRSSEFWL
jgi:hypothetical protein